ncbi:hypothetical protein [Labedaea rhizosphaerae]|uniref:Uncharacterized protein n=1 Tax=Labedaea rhizosphaerae TaxID=598644 RepID=A0A4R6S299_LABRH|nr:hypothetical protein [Labedaea rhizosphaerae]TDP93692.1 hypothetical protein EV186_10686 [Labedaea rhizosphaerae]
MREELAQEAAAIRDGAERDREVAILLAAATTNFPPDQLAALFSAAARRTTDPMIPGCALAETFLHGAMA